jgi:uncharacterized repeat protein (TIGR01451 family)
MRKIGRLLVALGILLFGTVVAPYAAFPSEKIGWQQFVGTYTATVDLAVTKSDSPDPAVVGGSLTYTIVVTNDGPDDATDVTLTDSLPDSVTLDSARASQGSCSGTSTIICDIGDLVAGDSVDVSIVVRPNTAGTITNHVSVVGNETDPDTSNNTASQSTTVDENIGIVAGYNGQPEASTTVHLPMAARGALNTELFVQNTTGADADITLTFYDDSGSAVSVVTDTLSPYGSGVYDQATMEDLLPTFEGGAIVTSTQPIVAIGNARPSDANSLLSYNGILASTAGETVILPSVVRQFYGYDSDIWIQNVGPNTVVTMTYTGQQNMGGEAVEAYITTTISSQAAHVYRLTDLSELSDGFYGSVMIESSSPLAIVVWESTVNGDDASAYTGIAVTDADSSVLSPRQQREVAGCSSGTRIMNVGVDSAVVESQFYADDGSLVYAESSSLEPGAHTFYYIPSMGIPDGFDGGLETISDQPLAVLINSFVSGSQGDSATQNSGLGRDQLQSYAHLPRVARVIADGVSTELSVQNAVTETAAVTITFYSTSGTATTVLTDSIPAHGVSRYTTEDMDVLGTDWEGSVIVEADQLIAVEAMQFEGKLTGTDLSVTKTDTVDPVAAGDTLTYTLQVTNNGPNEATGVKLVDSLPISVTYQSYTASQGVCSHFDGTMQLENIVTCELGNLSVDEDVVITLLVTPQMAGTITNTVSIAGNEPDHNASNNASTEDTTVILETDLSVTKSDSTDPISVGDPLTYTISVANNGPSDATGVILTDTLPVSVTYSSATTSQGSCSESSGVVTCALGALPAGDQATVTILVTSAATGTVNNLVEVAGNETDPNIDNNEAAEETTIASLILEADLSVTKSDSTDPISVGDPLTYTISVANNGPSDATGVILTDTLPVSVTYSSATTSQGSCSESSGVVTCALGALPAGDQATVTILVTSTATGTVNNLVEVAGDETDPNMDNNEAAEETTIASLENRVYLPLIIRNGQ